MSGWMRSRVLYTPPVKPWELRAPKTAGLTRKGGRCLRWDQWLGLSHNKVAVRERAAGSPPLKELLRQTYWISKYLSTTSCRLQLLQLMKNLLSVTDRYSVDSKRTENIWCKNNVNLSIQVIQIIKHKQKLIAKTISLRFFFV